MNQIIHGDCEKYLDNLSCQCLLADPPDGLGLAYDSYDDHLRPDYYDWLVRLIIKGAHCADHSWWLYYYRHDFEIKSRLHQWLKDTGYQWRMYYWSFTFGQAQQHDCTNGHRPILRLSKPGARLQDTRIPSDRQTIYHDKRASATGKWPDDIWQFPRVTGNNHERRSWHPTQIPEGVYQRIIRMSTSSPKDKVVDLFAGTGTLIRANHGLKEPRDCIAIEIDPGYCKHIAAEHNLKVEEL